MPKITAHGGPSNAAADEGTGVVVQAPIPVAAEEPAEVETVDYSIDYSAWTVKQLVAEIERRNEEGASLATTGNKGDLVARLVSDDEDGEE